MRRQIWILSFLLCILMFALSGCDWQIPSFARKPKTKKEQVAEWFEKNPPKHTESPAAQPTPTATAEPTPSPSPTPEPTATPIPTPTPTPTPIDWSKEYDTYFQKEQLLPANYRVETTIVLEGVEAQVSLSQTETFNQLHLGLGKTDILLISNETIAFLGKTDKKSTEWYYTSLGQGNSLEKVFGMDIGMDLNITGDIVIGQVYQGDVAEGEKIYDIIDIVTSQEYGKIKVRLYINRDTQEIEKAQTEYGGQEIVGYLYEIQPIELPEGSGKAKSLTIEEFSAKYKKMILQGVASAIGGKLWN